MVMAAHREGMQIAMHAIGDGAVQMGLDAYAKAQAATYLDKGISLSNGSDAPVELPHVMAGIQCAVTRRSLHTPMDAPYLPEEALSVAQAIDSFTMGGAHASFEEATKGRITPGMLADFVVLDRDPIQTPIHDLAQIQVCTTVLGGQTVYSYM